METKEKLIISRKHYKQCSKEANTIMRIGSEGCIYKFFSVMEDFKALIIEGISFRIVTPRIPDSFLDKTLELFRSFYRQKAHISLTVNDYGLLYALQSLGDISCWNIYLGRTLVRGLLYVPWSDYLLKREAELTQQALSQINMKDSVKLNFLKKLGVVGVEISAVKGIEKQLPYFAEQDIRIGMHVDSSIATVGRMCPTLRFYNKSIEECRMLCNNPLKLNVEKIWDCNGGMYQDKSADGILPNMLILENLVLIPLIKTSILDAGIATLTIIEDERLQYMGMETEVIEGDLHE